MRGCAQRHTFTHSVHIYTLDVESVYMYIYIYIFICAHFMYVCIYIYIHIHTHIPMRPREMMVTSKKKAVVREPQPSTVCGLTDCFDCPGVCMRALHSNDEFGHQHSSRIHSDLRSYGRCRLRVHVS